MTDLITLEEAAELLGADYRRLKWLRPYLMRFPDPVGRQGRGGGFVYERDKVIEYANHHDIHTELRTAQQRLRRNENVEVQLPSGVVVNMNNPFVKFASGVFGTAEQKERQAERIKQARLNKPVRKRVTLTPDWMIDQ